MKLLMIDQDREWVKMLAGWLQTRGCEVACAYDGNSAKAVWALQCPDLVLVDASLQGVDALALCRSMRKVHEAFIFVFSAHKDFQEEIRCLEAGADVYLRKPFSPALLLARLEAVSRRAGWTLPGLSSPVLAGGPLRLDTPHGQVTLNGKTVHLAIQKRKLLQLLATNEVCTLEQMVTCLWGDDGKEDLSSIRLEDDPTVSYVSITNPNFPTANQLLRGIIQEFEVPQTSKNYLELLNIFKNFLADQALNHQKTLVLLIDEAQTLKPPLLEMLRQLMNYESNDQKFLQVVLFAQEEFRKRLQHHRYTNLVNRTAMASSIETLSATRTTNH